jgi:hypothetical protein
VPTSRILVVIAWCALLPATIFAQGRPAPAAATVEHLRRHHHGGDWWRITTDSTRYEARVSAIDGVGLAGVKARHNTPPAPDRIDWGSIARIDRLESHKTRGHVRGVLLGLCAGFIPVATGSDSPPQLYMLVGGAAGYYLGGKLGEADVHEEPLYVAPTPPLSPVAPVVAAQPATTAVALPDDSIAAATAPKAPPAPRSRKESEAIDKACGRLSTTNLLRIEGDFGTFHGYAATIEPVGLSGLRVETTRPSVQLHGSLGWEHVDRIERHGNNAGRGAAIGGLWLGLVGGTLGFPIGALASDSNGASMAGIVAACAGVGVATGMVLGAAGGAMTSGWHKVYERP